MTRQVYTEWVLPSLQSDEKRRVAKESTKYITEFILPCQNVYSFFGICKLLIDAIIIPKFPAVLRGETRVTYVLNNPSVEEEARFSKEFTQIYMQII